MKVAGGNLILCGALLLPSVGSSSTGILRGLETAG
jgi:hypothetical protein